MKTKIEKIFQVIIQKKVYDVYNINIKKHAGYNDTPKTWWLYFSDRLPDGVSPNIESDRLVPFSSGIKRMLWEFKIKQNNTHKLKWDEHRFSNNICVEMLANNKIIYSFGTFDMNFALAKIQYLQVILSEHPYNFFEQEKELGRKIYWYGLPATVRPSSHPGEIGIVPDYSIYPKEEWWKEYMNRRSKVGYIPNEEDSCFEPDYLEDKQSDYINWGDALSDGNIDWFRKNSLSRSTGIRTSTPSLRKKSVLFVMFIEIIMRVVVKGVHLHELKDILVVFILKQVRTSVFLLPNDHLHQAL
jgi:hypothetical protein